MSKLCFALCTCKDALNILLVSSVETSTSSITSESPIQTPQITSKIPLEISTNQEKEKPEDQHTTPSSLSTSSNISEGHTDRTTTNAGKEAEMTSEHFGLNSSPIGSSTMQGEKTTLKTSPKASMVEIIEEASTETMDRNMDETSVQTASEGHSTKTLEITTFETTTDVLDEKGSEPSSTETPKSDLSTENRIENTFEVFTTEGSSSKNPDNTMLGVTSQVTEAQASEAVSIESYTTKLTEKSILNSTPETTVDKISHMVTTEAVSKLSIEETSPLESTSRATYVREAQTVSTDTYSTKSRNKPVLQETSVSPSQRTSNPGPTESPSTKAVDVHRFAVTSQTTGKETSQLTSTESHSTDSEENLIPDTTSAWSVGTISQADKKESSSTEVVTKATDGEASRTMSDKIPSTIFGQYGSTTERLTEKTSQPQTKVNEQTMSEITTQRYEVETSYSASTESLLTKFNSPMDQTSLPDTTQGHSNIPDKTFESGLVETSKAPSIDTYSTMSKDKLTTAPEPVMEQTSVPESLTNPSTKAVKRVMFETSSTEVITSETVSTEDQSTTSEHEPMLARTTPERSVEEIAQTLITYAADRSTPIRLSQADTSQGASTEGHRILSTEATIPQTTSVIPTDKTSQTATSHGPSTTAIEKELSETSSETTEMETSDAVLTQGYSTKPEHKPLFELTTPENLMDETSQLVAMGSSSMKAVDKPVLESTSVATSLETSQLASTESRSTKTVEELPPKVTSEPDNLETSGPLEFTRRVTTHSPEEGNVFVLINEMSPHKNQMYIFQLHNKVFALLYYVYCANNFK